MATSTSVLVSKTVSTTVPSEILYPPQHGQASCGGHGTYEIRELIGMLEEHGIICCLVGVSALVFYGAERMRHDWEICVPSAKANDAVTILCSDNIYLPVQHQLLPQPASLAHTYPRFCRKGVDVQFVLVPSHDAHIECSTSTIQRSSNGLPYPALYVLVQSFIDTNDIVALCDIIDGTNVSEEWGNIHLELDGTNDLRWAKRMNDQLYSLGNRGVAALVSLFPTEVVSRRYMWESRVRRKTARLGWTHPVQLFDTRFRLKDSDDPWQSHRQSC